MKYDIAFISHGGGPMPLLGDPQHAELVSMLKQLPSKFPKPRAIVVISAHWESDEIAITSSSSPSLLFDYFGFPAESYQFKYPAPGNPQLASNIAKVLQVDGFNVRLYEERGLDHGVFIPLMLMYPQADIPVLQISLSSSLDPLQHLQLGEALAKLDEEGVLFLGSGFSFHNMRAFFADSAEIRSANLSFESWLTESLTNSDLEYTQIKARLVEWNQAPGAHFCHPREEHLLPLHVCAGIAGRSADSFTNIDILNKQASNYLWQAA
ncbi:class III extradiol ring-cleavage dioxygenase [Marinobacterium sp. LSUCC0821]|uniref:DODA-type extradiol aromatic ring-opening family dioxygenase n=1 Tax=Marinobacterium sp. LSUCC0821 TaxID=2668067 RepID=UPI001452940E|nr:class III extradiol ring-cleavage dioxygenase [Marinobacterium sp. LSUCC0821]QJD70899.1 dioxygenase [Marinobacterium sp. LSUCC0821]